MIESPLNYTGGKCKLLSQILPLFPKDIERFVDIFCGGCNVGSNVNSSSTLFNDSNKMIVSLFKVLKENSLEVTKKKIYGIIDKYSLSLVSNYGYEHYGCSSGDGLAKYNKPHFIRLRNDFNHRKRKDDDYYYMFYVLIVYAFNNQIRFNSKNEYNLPVGKRDFNESMEAKLTNFIHYLQTNNVSFSSKDFRKVELNSETDFVYADPPYLITCATYNENGGWGEEEEISLLNFLDNISEKGIKFALSNVLSSKGKKNNILLSWLNKHNEYKVIHLDFTYSNSNYHTKDKKTKSDEVLIINY